jgi:transposase
MDVHKDTVAACVLIWEAGGARRQKRIFGTTTKDLLASSDWLHSHEVTHVAMESTGVYFALSSALIGVQVPPALG